MNNAVLVRGATAKIKQSKYRIQFYQIITLRIRIITNVPPYISNQILRNNLHNKTIEQQSAVHITRDIPSHVKLTTKSHSSEM